MTNDRPTDHLTADSLVSNGSGGGTAADEGGHRLQIRLVMGGHTSGGTAASEGGTVSSTYVCVFPAVFFSVPFCIGTIM
jgi:hypothetical protein